MISATTCSEKTKQKMAYALKELMRNLPFDRITVSDVTDACGVHRQTFYYHFQDKFELLDWLLYSELLHPFITGFNFDNMYERFFVLFETMYSDKKFYQNALRINSGDFSRYISKVATEDFIKVIQRIAIENGIESDDKTSLGIAEFLGYGISGVVQSWTLKGMKETPKEMSDRVEFIVESTKKIVDSKD